LDIIGNTIGRYFDYKRDTEIIQAKREELKHQAKIALSQIDAELTKSLDSNRKNYKREMHRLNSIARELKGNRANKNHIVKTITKLTKEMTDPRLDIEEKRIVLEVIRLHRDMLIDFDSDSNIKLNFMSNFDSNSQKIER